MCFCIVTNSYKAGGLLFTDKALNCFKAKNDFVDDKFRHGRLSFHTK